MVKTIEDYNFPSNLNPTSKSDVFYFLTKIYQDKSCRLFVESIFSKIFKEVYEDFQNHLHIFPKDFSFSQKMFHFLQDDYELNIGKCKMCGKRCKYINLKKGYYTYCCRKCIELDHDYIQEKTKQTNLEKWGCEYTFQTENNLSKSRQTKLERYGNETFTNTAKAQQTKLERYGDENYNNIEKYKQTCLEKYGFKSYVQSKEYREQFRKIYYSKSPEEQQEIIKKIKSTKLEKYGDENYNNREQYFQTCMETYGVHHYSQTEEFIDKIKSTNMQKYGVEWLLKNPEIKTKIFTTIQERYNGIGFASEELNRKTQDTINELYGNPVWVKTDDFKHRCNEIVSKQHQTKRERKSFHSTKLEDEIAKYLIENNINFISQYESPEYPFLCDFYFPDYDLYVEIQGYWCHCNHPFDENDEDDMVKLEMWKEKSNSNQYTNAIYVWTISDPLKRRTAKENNLNYLEIFSNDINDCIFIIQNAINNIS